MNKIKAIAEYKDIPMAQVAQAVGLTPTGLSRIIRANSTRVDTLQRIADYLDVDIRIFFSEDDPSEIDSRRVSILQTEIKKRDALLAQKEEQISDLIRALNR